MAVIAHQNESYEVFLQVILVTVVILSLQLKIKSVKKQRQTMGRKIFMEYHLIFSLWNISLVILSRITPSPPCLR